MPQPTIRALLQGPKDSPGMIRTAFTAARLRKLQKLFKSYGYQPLPASRHSTPESLPKETALLSPPVRATQ